MTDNSVLCIEKIYYCYSIDFSLEKTADPPTDHCTTGAGGDDSRGVIVYEFHSTCLGKENVTEHGPLSALPDKKEDHKHPTW